MVSSDLLSASLQLIAERGMSSFLQATDEAISGIDMQRAIDCWIGAVETTDWIPEMGSERFVRLVTAKALATCAGHAGPASGQCTWPLHPDTD